jgi:hypothetical protein
MVSKLPDLVRDATSTGARSLSGTCDDLADGAAGSGISVAIFVGDMRKLSLQSWSCFRTDESVR